jgi:hypothetical protein
LLLEVDGFKAIEHKFPLAVNCFCLKQTMEMKEELQVKEEKIDIETDFLATIISNEEGSLARSVSAETVLQIRIRDLGSGIRCLFDPEIRYG